MTMLMTEKEFRVITNAFSVGVICQLVATTTLTTEATGWIETITDAIALST